MSDAKPRKKIKRFTIGTFNLRNLALAGHPIYERPGLSQASFVRKVVWTADQLDRMGAGIVGFQEVFHRAALEEVLERSKVLSGASLIVRGETGDKPVVGLATNFPLAGTPRLIRNIPRTARVLIDDTPVPVEQFSRPILQVPIEVHGIVVDVWVTHLKSKLPLLRDDEDKNDPFHVALGEARALVTRAVEAIGLRQLLVARRRREARPTILLGDANDQESSVTTRIISGPSPWKGLSFEQKLEAWNYLMWDVVEMLQRRTLGFTKPYTHIYNGHYERLDGITVTRDFVSGNPDRVAMLDGVRFFVDHLVDDMASGAYLPKWQSDHGQITATFRMV